MNDGPNTPTGLRAKSCCITRHIIIWISPDNILEWNKDGFGVWENRLDYYSWGLWLAWTAKRKVNIFRAVMRNSVLFFCPWPKLFKAAVLKYLLNNGLKCHLSAYCFGFHGPHFYCFGPLSCSPCKPHQALFWRKKTPINLLNATSTWWSLWCQIFLLSRWRQDQS